MRIGRHRYFMNMARAAAERGTCPRLKVGAVLVDHRGRVLSTGYNGSPPGAYHCDDVGCVLVNGHCIGTIHAELNALLFADRNDGGEKPTMMYVTHTPCLQCVKAAIAYGVSEIVYEEFYDDPLREEFLLRRGMSSGLNKIAKSIIHIHQFREA